MSENTKQPTHELHYVTDDDDRAYWARLGFGWEHKDGEGMSLNIKLMPTDTSGRFVIRKVKAKGDENISSKAV